MLCSNAICKRLLLLSVLKLTAVVRVWCPDRAAQQDQRPHAAEPEHPGRGGPRHQKDQEGKLRWVKKAHGKEEDLLSG